MKIKSETMWAMARISTRSTYIIGATVSRTRKQAIEKVEAIMGDDWRPFSRRTGAKIIKVRVEAMP